MGGKTTGCPSSQTITSTGGTKSARRRRTVGKAHLLSVNAVASKRDAGVSRPVGSPPDPLRATARSLRRAPPRKKRVSILGRYRDGMCSFVFSLEAGSLPLNSRHRRELHRPGRQVSLLLLGWHWGHANMCLAESGNSLIGEAHRRQISCR